MPNPTNPPNRPPNTPVTKKVEETRKDHKPVISGPANFRNVTPPRTPAVDAQAQIRKTASEMQRANNNVTKAIGQQKTAQQFNQAAQQRARSAAFNAAAKKR